MAKHELQKRRLADLVQEAVGGCARNWADVIAGHLLDNGVTVLPCKIGDEFWTEWVGIRKVRCSMITQKANGSWKGRFTVENSGGASIDITFGNNERELFLTKEEAESYFAQPPKGE